VRLDLRPLAGDDLEALLAFFDRIPEGERTFFKEDVDAAAVRRWLDPDARGRRVVAVSGGRIVGSVGVIRLRGWSDHVGEVRLVVDPACRHRGVGRALARRALLEAVDCGLRRLVVEVVSGQPGTLGMFEALGFRAEGLLYDHVRDHDGRLHDLIVLGHSVDDHWAAMSSAGIADALG
jgi:L-amino acid N-acyltransferase YncA